MRLIKSYLFVLLALLATPLYAIEGPVQLESGKISGVALDQDITAFRGIPFAAPPVGDLRWRPPAPVIPWEGVRQSDTFGPMCMQRSRGNTLMSEDCLYLNVWTGAKSATEKRPVMVWIHGGAWVVGAGSNAIYNGAAFAREGVVIVTVNYRMGPLGFLVHPALSAESEHGASGNYAILDHIAALHWVQDNIGQFGGDPDNVTIFGESAGGGSVYALLVSPLAKGLFHKAIGESIWVADANFVNLKTATGFMPSAESVGKTAVAQKLAELKQEKTDDVLATLRNLSAAEAMSIEMDPKVAMDGWIFPEPHVESIVEGNYNQVPVLAGVNDGEGLFFIRSPTFTTVDEQRAALIETYGGEDKGDLSGILDHYVAKTPDDIWMKEIDHLTDITFALSNRRLLRAAAKSPEASYMYVFTRNASSPELPAAHAAELRYVFNAMGDRAAPEDKTIANSMQRYWVNFAKTGNPNGPGLPNWPEFDLQNENHLVIDTKVTTGSFFRKTQLDVLESYTQQRNAKAKQVSRQ